MKIRIIKYGLCIEAVLFLFLIVFTAFGFINHHNSVQTTGTSTQSEKKFIKWVDFNVTYSALNTAYQCDVETHGTETPLNWIELLAYTASRNGGNFSSFKPSQITSIAEKIKSKETTMNDLSKELKYYNYYLESYSAILGGLVGEYQIQEKDPENESLKVWVTKYGLKGFSPLAMNYYYSDFDDFGVSRSYGFKRQHLGHDMMGSVGAPVIAVESGYVEILGWNQYGGWRIGIRSFDKKRYYYYAHLRKDFPYNKSLKEGDIVTAGDVIGYLGHTGYSTKENVSNITTPHLHFGLQLIFDESQKEGNNEIWVDCYSLTKFLYQNRVKTVKSPNTKESFRAYQMIDPAAVDYHNCQKSE